jgi:hypothetical protein
MSGCASPIATAANASAAAFIARLTAAANDAATMADVLRAMGDCMDPDQPGSGSVDDRQALRAAVGV